MVFMYGKDWTQWNRACIWFVKYIVDNFSYLLIDNLAYWQPFFAMFADKISAKITEKSNGNIVYAPGTYNVAGFYDCTVTMTSKPGGGPAGAGVGAPRHNNLIQECFYNGWKKYHGIKYQSMELPNGMCADLFGPKSFR